MPNNKSHKNANGAGSLRKRKNGLWEARYTAIVNGRPAQKSIYGKTQTEVRKKLAAITVELDEGSYLEPTKYTLESWCKEWLEIYVKPSVKRSTYDKYENDMRVCILPKLGMIKLTDLDAARIQHVYNDLLKDHAVKGVKNIHGELHRCLQQAVLMGYIKNNPTERCVLPKGQCKKIEILEMDDVIKFLEAIKNDRFGVIFYVTLFTGLRESEVLGLTWDCVDFEAGEILVNKQLAKTKHIGGDYTFTPTKNGKERYIPVAPTVLRTLTEYRKIQDGWKEAAGCAWNKDLNLVFTNEIGDHLVQDTVYTHFKKIAAQIGKPDLRFHSLRHSYAVSCLEFGDDIKTVQENLGHASAAFTLDVYGHVSRNMKRRSAQHMEEFIKKVS